LNLQHSTLLGFVLQGLHEGCWESWEQHALEPGFTLHGLHDG
jgi:hypothetical protein